MMQLCQAAEILSVSWELLTLEASRWSHWIGLGLPLMSKGISVQTDVTDMSYQ
jgi:hypothetical protein